MSSFQLKPGDAALIIREDGGVEPVISNVAECNANILVTTFAIALLHHHADIQALVDKCIFHQPPEA